MLVHKFISNCEKCSQNGEKTQKCEWMRDGQTRPSPLTLDDLTEEPTVPHESFRKRKDILKAEPQDHCDSQRKDLVAAAAGRSVLLSNYSERRKNCSCGGKVSHRDRSSLIKGAFVEQSHFPHRWRSSASGSHWFHIGAIINFSLLFSVISFFFIYFTVFF